MTAPSFLEDGAVSMASMFLMAHHGLRRDLALFARALRAPGGRSAALAEEWASYRATLHGHHTVEDTSMFPDMRAKNPALAGVIDQLSSDHARIDPLLATGDAAFARLAAGAGEDGAARVVAELLDLLGSHLALEEREIVPLLRSVTRFEMPPLDEAMAATMAGGFAWSVQGVAPEVVEQVFAMLPEAVVTRLPAARVAYGERFARAFGGLPVGDSRTAEPEGLDG